MDTHGHLGTFIYLHISLCISTAEAKSKKYAEKQKRPDAATPRPALELPDSTRNRDSNNPIFAGLASPHVADHQRQVVGVLEFLNGRFDGVLAAVDVFVGLFRDLYLTPERALQKAEIGAVVRRENRRA